MDGKSISLVEISADGGRMNRHPALLEPDPMSSHRLFGEGVIVAQPRPTGLSVQGFMVCPLPLGSQACAGGADGWVQGIYSLAYQQAQAALLRPWHERSLLASRN